MTNFNFETDKSEPTASEPEFSEAFSLHWNELEAGVPLGLRGFVYHKPLAAWKHASGAWLCVEQIPGFPIYMILWRAVPYWNGCTIAYVDAFQCPDEDIAWGDAMRQAKIAFKRGPRGAVLEKAAATVKTLSEGGRKGGKRSGEVRSVKAQEQAEEEEHARELSIKIIRSDKIPKYKAAKWTYEVRTDLPEMFFMLAYKPIKGTYICARQNHGWWDVERDFYPDGNDDTGRIEETLKELVSYDEALQIMNALAASDPVKWMKRDIKQFI
jgi:hypothetical protein